MNCNDSKILSIITSFVFVGNKLSSIQFVDNKICHKITNVFPVDIHCYSDNTVHNCSLIKRYFFYIHCHYS